MPRNRIYLRNVQTRQNNDFESSKTNYILAENSPASKKKIAFFFRFQENFSVVILSIKINDLDKYGKHSWTTCVLDTLHLFKSNAGKQVQNFARGYRPCELGPKRPHYNSKIWHFS